MTCKHFQRVAANTYLPVVAQAHQYKNCPWCESERLRGTLSLAEEGLANYEEENQRLKAALERIQQERLTWAMTCHPHECTACDLLDRAIRASQPAPDKP